MIIKHLTAIFAVCLLASATSAHDEAPKASSLFGSQQVGSSQQPQPIGSYAKGCLAGGVQLAESGPTWQAMRLSRNRNWGHPSLIDFIERLGKAASELGWSGIYVGDLSQPRGGPMTSGHRSHQIGLDVDFWMLPAHRLDLSRQEREELSSISVRLSDQTDVNEHWTQTHMDILKAAASDEAVDRIFVAAAIKKTMCLEAGADREWLQKIRPLYGHDAHFHVRLRCPPGAGMCITQKPTVSELSNGGDGCDHTLDWWLTDYLEFLKKPADEKPKPASKPRRHPRDYTMADLPDQCQTVIDAG